MYSCVILCIFECRFIVLVSFHNQKWSSVLIAVSVGI